MPSDHLTAWLPTPFHSLPTMPNPPTEMDLVLPDLLEKCESLAAVLEGALSNREFLGFTAETMVTACAPSARRLHEYLTVVRRVYTAWNLRPLTPRKETSDE